MSFKNVKFEGSNMDKSFTVAENRFVGVYIFDVIRNSLFFDNTFVRPNWDDLKHPPHAPPLITLEVSDKCVAPFFVMESDELRGHVARAGQARAWPRSLGEIVALGGAPNPSPDMWASLAANIVTRLG